MATGSQQTPFQVLAESLINLPDTLYANTALTQLPRFSGKSSEFHDWTLELERFFMIHNCDEARKIKIVFQTASGPVCEFLKRFLTTNPEVRYIDLKAELKMRYGDITDPQYALKLLRNVKQRAGENVANYGERLLMLARDACEGELDERDPMQRILVGQFTDGLIDQPVRNKLIRSNPSNLTEAVNMALKEQNILKRVNMRKGHGEYESHDHGPQPMEIDHARPTRRCYKCGRKNHIAKNCRTVNAVSQQKELDKQRNQCYTCHSTGHFVRDCPLKKVPPKPRLELDDYRNKCHNCLSTNHFIKDCPKPMTITGSLAHHFHTQSLKAKRLNRQRPFDAGQPKGTN